MKHSTCLTLPLLVLHCVFVGHGVVDAFRATPIKQGSITITKNALPAEPPVYAPLPPSIPIDPLGLDVTDDLNPQPLFTPPVRVDTNKKSPSIKTWVRRLRTKEDYLSLHKISNIGFMVSSTVILGGMLLVPNEQGQFLHDFPSWLAPFDFMFLLSSTVQSLVAIPMIKKFRNKDPEAAATQLGMGLVSMQMAAFSTWQSPFCPGLLQDHWRPLFAALIGAIAWFDYNAAFGKYNVIQEQMEDVGVTTELQTWQDKLNHFITFQGGFIAGSSLNLCMLMFFFIIPDREQLLQLIQTGFNLPLCSGAELPMTYWSTILAGTLIGYQSLFATLANKKLVTADTATAFITISSVVLFTAFGHNLFAHNLYSCPGQSPVSITY